MTLPPAAALGLFASAIFAAGLPPLPSPLDGGEDCPGAEARRSDGAAEKRVGFKGLGSVPAGALPPFRDDLDAASAAEAARRTREYWARRPPSETVLVGGSAYTAEHLAKGLEELERLILEARTSEEFLRGVLERFDLYESAPEEGAYGTVTGYFDAAIPVRREPGPDFIPLYARPPEPFRSASRREIGRGALAGLGLELYWTRHPADLLVLQTQGSGLGVLPDGSRRRLSYDGTNDRPFRSVARALAECGLIPRETDPSEVLRYLKSLDPGREAALVGLNPRYVFFKDAGEASGGPAGAAGVVLTPGRSVATDPEAIPLGLPGLLFSRRPVTNASGRIAGAADFSRLVFAQDTGSAIRGPGRLDLFWGEGPRPEEEARHMNYPGRFFALTPKTGIGR